VRGRLWRETTRTLLRRYRDGDAAIDAYAEDYACLIWGLLELFQATGGAEWLEWAVTLQRRQDELFWDEDEAGWFSTTGRDPSVLLRLKEEYDGAEPAAGSISVMNLLVLSHLRSDPAWHARVERTLARFGPRLGQAARVVPFMASALAAFHSGLGQVVIVGPPERADTVALRRVLATTYAPFAVVVPVAPGPEQRRLAELLAWIEPMTEIGGRSAAYVCRGFTCERPVVDPGDLAGLIRQGRASA
jgi:hypothetical protein